ncbi:MAG: helix-turn-helix transcriptional regulator [Chloroflexota bacterium]
MTNRERSVSRGSRLAHEDLVRIGAEFRMARVAAGLSLAFVGAAVGLSRSHLARIERAQVRYVGVRYLARIGAALGLDVRVRAYPGGDALRDAGHGRLGSRLRVRIHPGVRIRSERLLPDVDDARAWDLWLDGWPADPDGDGLPVELETRVSDYQALVRRLNRKMRDGRVSSVLLVVADTASNRRAIAAAGAQVGADFPVSARAALASLAAGECPAGSALIFI